LVGWSESDRILFARISGVASRHAGRRVSETARARAVADLAELAAGRSDLLARYAGLAVGVHEGDLDEERYLRAAQLCIDAGADTSLIPAWIDRGRSRANNAAANRQARWPSVEGQDTAK
jgi:hypothetical protein